MRTILSFLLSYLLFSTQTWALTFNQGKAKQFSMGTTSEFVFQSYPGQDLISIKLLGAVKKAGMYHIPKDMDLVSLLSLAGGTTNDADLEKIVIGKPAPTNEQPGLSVNLEDNIQRGNTKAYLLKPDDIVLVKRKEPLVSGDTWRVVSIISVLLTSALTALAITDNLKK